MYYSHRFLVMYTRINNFRKKNSIIQLLIKIPINLNSLQEKNYN